MRKIDEPGQSLSEKDLRDLYDVELRVVELNFGMGNTKTCLPVF